MTTQRQSEHFRYSVSRQVLIGLILIVLLFSILVGYNVFLYRKLISAMSLINTTYMPLALGTSEIQTTQTIFNTLTDRLTYEPDHPMTRDWINAARKYRPEALGRLVRRINDTLRQSERLSNEEIVFLKEIRNRLRDVRQRYRLNENKFARLFTELDMGRSGGIDTNLEDLKRSERLLNNVLSGISEDIRGHIESVSRRAIREGIAAIAGLILMGFIALLIGIVIILSTRRLLSPLGDLREAVSQVAAGNLQTHTHIVRQDEIGALALSFNRMTDALQERDDRLRISERLATAGKIAAQVTHEIRNPLTSLDLNTDLLREEILKSPSSSSSECIPILNAIQDEIERLTRITEAYLRFARLPNPIRKEGHFHETIQSCLEFMKPELNSANIHIELKLNANPDSLKYDREQFRQLIINLLRNALQAMSEGGSIRIETERQNELLFFSIQDSGPGVPGDMRENLFDPFFTTKSDGTGLGLAMVRQICLAHHGKIQYINTIEGGARFTVSIDTTARDGEPPNEPKNK